MRGKLNAGTRRLIYCVTLNDAVGLHGRETGEDVEELAVAGGRGLSTEKEFVHCDRFTFALDVLNLYLFKKLDADGLSTD